MTIESHNEGTEILEVNEIANDASVTSEVSVINEKSDQISTENEKFPEEVSETSTNTKIENEAKENDSVEKITVSKTSHGKKIYIQRWDNLKCCFLLLFMVFFFIWLAGYMAYSQGHLDRVIKSIRKVLNL